MKQKAKGCTCSTEGCQSAVVSRGLCNKHYHDYRKAQKMKPCACGCGAPTSYTYKHGHNARTFTREEQSRRASSPNNGDSKRGVGEGKTYRKRGGRHEHRVTMERLLGRPLKSCEVVHHRNGDKFDNSPEILELMTRTEHINEHRQDLIDGRLRAKGF